MLTDKCKNIQVVHPKDVVYWPIVQALMFWVFATLQMLFKTSLAPQFSPVYYFLPQLLVI